MLDDAHTSDSDFHTLTYVVANVMHKTAVTALKTNDLKPLEERSVFVYILIKITGHMISIVIGICESFLIIVNLLIVQLTQTMKMNKHS